MKMPGWFLKLRKDAPTQDPAYDALLKRGYTTSRGKVCVVNASHAAALHDNSYGPYDYDAPSPRDPSTEAAVMAKTAIGYLLHSEASALASAPTTATIAPASTVLPSWP